MKKYRSDDIETVRNQVNLDELIGQYVMLKPGGVGSLKGLCPFHDEKTPSFHVRPAQGFYHCFGCGKGGDAITFVRDYLHLDFVEAVEYLADRVGYHLVAENISESKRDTNGPRISRQRILDANRQAETFFNQQLTKPDAQTARDFLLNRGFSAQVASYFHLGYAPDSWDELLKHLRKRGFTEVELAASGLFSKGQRGIYDRFRGRLIWPIRDLTGATIGFGARRLNDDDQGPKYLNTPETAVYKKSQVLYGIDLAKKPISEQRRIVVVEGYTDVMAMHLSGVNYAVATCGTAFGEGHVRVARRLLGDNADPTAGIIFSDGKTRGSEVIFTFDGDAAGQKAALKAFNEDQNFAAQTFVSIESTGKDPCELWQAQGPDAVQQLVEKRIPLFEFVLNTLISGHSLDLPQGRIQALRACLPVVVKIKDLALREEYGRLLAGWLGLNESLVAQELRQEIKRNRRMGSGKTNQMNNAPTMAAIYEDDRADSSDSADSPISGSANVDPNLLQSKDPVIRRERQALQALLQYPKDLVGIPLAALSPTAFQVPVFKEIFLTIAQNGYLDSFITAWQQAEQSLGAGYSAVAQATQVWVGQLFIHFSPSARAMAQALVVAPLPQDDPEMIRSFARGIWRSVYETDLSAQCAQIKQQLQRLQSDRETQKQLLEKLLELQTQRRQLKLDD